MVTVLSNPKQSFGRSLSESLSQHLPGAISSLASELTRPQREAEAYERQQQLAQMKYEQQRALALEQIQEKQKAKQQASQQLLSQLGFAPTYEATNEPTGLQDMIAPGRGGKLSNFLLNEQETQSIEQQKPYYEKFTDEQLAGMSLIPDTKAFADTVIKQKKAAKDLEVEDAKLQRQRFEADRNFESKRSDPVIAEKNKLERSLPRLESSLGEMESAIKSGELESFTNTLADITGIEPLRSAEASKFKTAAKDYFLSTIKSIPGSRLNQFLERQINDGIPKIGRSQEGNLYGLNMYKFNLDLDKEWVKTINDLEEKYRKEYGYVPGDIEREASKIMQPYINERQKQLSYDMRAIKEKYNPEIIDNLDKVEKGTPLTRRTAEYLYDVFGDDAEAAALELGYTIPDESFFEREI